MLFFRGLIVSLAVLLIGVEQATAIDNMPAQLNEQKIGFFTQLGTKIDKNLPFVDREGKTVLIGDLLTPKVPTIFIPVYYGCPRLCGLLLNGFVKLVREMNLTMGTEYNVITLSFDPDEKSDLANDKSNTVYAEVLREDVNAANWHFLVGAEANIKALMDQIGFRYKRDGDEYAHSSGIIILTPDGEISQYFTGIEFSPWDVRLSLIEASKGTVGSAVDHILLFCYRFDPSKGKYTLVAFNVLRSGVLASILLFAGIIYMYSRRVKRA